MKTKFRPQSVLSDPPAFIGYYERKQIFHNDELRINGK